RYFCILRLEKTTQRPPPLQKGCETAREGTADPWWGEPRRLFFFSSPRNALLPFERDVRRLIAPPAPTSTRFRASHEGRKGGLSRNRNTPTRGPSLATGSVEIRGPTPRMFMFRLCSNHHPPPLATAWSWRVEGGGREFGKRQRRADPLRSNHRPCWLVAGWLDGRTGEQAKSEDGNAGPISCVGVGEDARSDPSHPHAPINLAPPSAALDYVQGRRGGEIFVENQPYFLPSCDGAFVESLLQRDWANGPPHMNHALMSTPTTCLGAAGGLPFLANDVLIQGYWAVWPLHKGFGGIFGFWGITSILLTVARCEKRRRRRKGVVRCEKRLPFGCLATIYGFWGVIGPGGTSFFSPSYSYVFWRKLAFSVLW
ncbi:hypothetical protein FPV67DRAFT_1446286, partial [Lyophyllum atratum]